MDDATVNRSEEILGFWFGDLDQTGLAAREQRRRWWKRAPELDREIRERFLVDHRRAVEGELAAWLEKPRSALAYVLLLDQFSRNLFRDTPLMFAADPQALAAACASIERGFDVGLPYDPRAFFYLPLMHSERLEDQQLCVEKFRALAESLEGPAAQAAAASAARQNLGFAERHRDIVERFGRFPHRNAVLGRKSTPEELEFLKEPGSSF